MFLTELLNKTESYWGYSNTAYSIGIITSGLIAFRLSEKFLAAKWKSIIFPLVSIAIVTLAIILFPNAQMFLFFSALVGMLSQLKEVPESVFLQETVEENNLVNVYSVIEVISTLSFQLFYVTNRLYYREFWHYHQFFVISNLSDFRSYFNLY